MDLRVSRRRGKIIKILASGGGFGFILGLISGLPVLSKAFIWQSMLGWLLIGFVASLMGLLMGLLVGWGLVWWSERSGWRVEAMMVGIWLGVYFWLSYIDQKALVYTEGHWVGDPVKVLEALGWGFFSMGIAVLVSRGLSEIMKWRVGVYKSFLVAWLIVAIGVVGLMGWAPGLRKVWTKREPESEERSLILVTVDTLRADAVSGGLMPETEKFFEEGWRRDVYTPSPWTAPSFASMFSGKVPTEIGADEEMEVVLEKNKGVERIFLPKEVETLAERLESEGYVTQAVVNNFLLNEERGFDQGFEGFYNREDVRGWHWVGANQKVSLVKLWHRIPGVGGVLRRGYSRVVGKSYQPWKEDGADLIIEEGIEWLEGRKEKEGVFFWLHLVDPHSPYKYHSEYGVESDVSPREIRSLEHFDDELKMRLREVDKKAVKELYEGEVRFTDQGLGRLWKYLEENWGEAVVIFTSDHGEEFWEHGHLGHVRSYYEETVRVPLMIKGVEKRELEGELSLVDFEGTVLEILGFEDKELFSWFDEEYLGKTIWFDADGRGPIRKGLREERWKFIEDIDGNKELYDLSWDKKEQVNLVDNYPLITEDLSRKLNEFYEEKERESLKIENGFESGVFVGY